ncbi:SHOCT domain-containing protein [Candidatus Cetobacterium colombiensis]|uniref:SHOCT domain-containing protein n=1 Tax=Candidatus Cetobacterium colombiensis TaxID=3073100 RepID=A0ABU4WEH4_9FUSO|nr:SHOCT domain-containing protein [Candidatus Cetobacterium colombiensis]MDX8336805.1 SHOCT domain-containing protein [Candidatus Cetobacterium colombiensis]
MFGGVFFIIIVVIAILFFSKNGNNFGNFTQTKQDTALELLKKRYAKGEITKEEYEKIKKDLENN